MKIRNGFVSNSSASSFCVYGTDIDLNEAMEALLGRDKEVTITPGCEHEFDREASKFCAECGSPAWNEEEEEWYIENLETEAEKVDLYTYQIHGCEDYEDGTVILGARLHGLGGKRATKKNPGMIAGIEETLEKLFGEDVEVDFHNGTCWG